MKDYGMAEVSGVWSGHARRWSAIGVPQRPTPEDSAIFFGLVRDKLSQASLAKPATGDDPIHHACILGVTPELVQGNWPSGTVIDSFDRSEDMIAQHWKEHTSVPSRVHRAEWHAMPVENARFAVIVGDGCTTQFPTDAYYGGFFREMHRVLSPGGGLFLRCFLSPNQRRTEEEILQQVKDRQFHHFGTLKWQIAMMLTDPATIQVRVDHIAQTFDRLFPDRTALGQHMGWPEAEINTIDTYRGQNTTYTFPTLADFTRLCEPHFEVHSIRHGSYELADCCPILAMTPVVRDKPTPL